MFIFILFLSSWTLNFSFSFLEIMWWIFVAVASIILCKRYSTPLRLIVLSRLQLFSKSISCSEFMNKRLLEVISALFSWFVQYLFESVKELFESLSCQFHSHFFQDYRFLKSMSPVWFIITQGTRRMKSMLPDSSNNLWFYSSFFSSLSIKGSFWASPTFCPK